MMSQYRTIKCHFCEGRGVVFEYGKPFSCGRCDGRGFVNLRTATGEGDQHVRHICNRSKR